jgi:predicted RNA-binding Zn-ribbon protein involved in translation (DUF1610 family)
MTMSDWWICDICKSEVRSDEVKKVWLSLTDDPRDKVEYWLCPYCGEEYLEEADECEICGRIVKKDDMIDGVCDDCIEEMIAKCKQQRNN